MKIAARRRFWSLRPRLSAGALELGCWLAAGLLATALAISLTAPAERPTSSLVISEARSIVVPEAPDLPAYRQHCIDRVLAGDLGMTEEYVVRQITQQCSTRRRIATHRVGLACSRAFLGQVTPMARRVRGCPAD